MVRVISIVCLMYADDNGLSTHSPAHASIFLQPSIIHSFCPEGAADKEVGGNDEASPSEVLLERSSRGTLESPLILSEEDPHVQILRRYSMILREQLQEKF